MSRVRANFSIRARNGAVNILTALLIEPLAVRLKHEDLYASCLTCRYMEKSVAGTERDLCKKYQACPPIEILVNGCEGYSDNDEIPY